MDAIGHILAAPILADRPQPPYRRATMDGIALRGGDDLTSWSIAGLHAAGDPPPRALSAGEAWEIMTGAQVPDDCDTLIPYEEIEIANNVASLRGEAVPHRYIHETGSDAPAGATLVETGALLGPIEIAIAASVGLPELPVSRRPRIAVLTTGDEAIAPDATPQAWQIRRSNGPMLAALLRRDGFHDVTCEHVCDDPAELEQTVERLFAACDVVLLCGGISKGKRDYVRTVIETRLGPPALHGVTQRPGKPMAFWAGETPVFALPGNPVSVLATFTRYVRPALHAMQGGTPCEPTKVTLAEDFQPLAKLTWFAPARIVDGLAHPILPQNSGDFISIAGATHLLEIPPGTTTLPAQHRVSAYPLFA